MSFPVDREHSIEDKASAHSPCASLPPVSDEGEDLSLKDVDSSMSACPDSNHGLDKDIKRGLERVAGRIALSSDGLCIPASPKGPSPCPEDLSTTLGSDLTSSVALDQQTDDCEVIWGPYEAVGIGEFLYSLPAEEEDGAYPAEMQYQDMTGQIIGPLGPEDDPENDDSFDDNVDEGNRFTYFQPNIPSPAELINQFQFQGQTYQYFNQPDSTVPAEYDTHSHVAQHCDDPHVGFLMAEGGDISEQDVSLDAETPEAAEVDPIGSIWIFSNPGQYEEGTICQVQSPSPSPSKDTSSDYDVTRASQTPERDDCTAQIPERDDCTAQTPERDDYAAQTPERDDRASPSALDYGDLTADESTEEQGELPQITVMTNAERAAEDLREQRTKVEREEKRRRVAQAPIRVEGFPEGDFPLPPGIWDDGQEQLVRDYPNHLYGKYLERLVLECGWTAKGLADNAGGGGKITRNAMCKRVAKVTGRWKKSKKGVSPQILKKEEE